MAIKPDFRGQIFILRGAICLKCGLVGFLLDVNWYAKIEQNPRWVILKHAESD